MAAAQQEPPHRAAAALLDFLVELPLLLPADKKGVLRLIQGLDPSGFDLIARSGHGISVFRTDPCSSNRIYRVTGMGEVAAAPRGVFELLCNLSLIPEWDVLFQAGQYLSYVVDPAGRCEVAYMRIVYGLPGVSNLVSDRDFVLRAVRVFFPNGMCVLSCQSVAPGEAVPGDPGPQPRMIRGQMWHSGYVVVPTSSGCCISVTLQVDPKGWIPTSVINWSLEAIPLNIQRVRAAVQRLGPDVMAALPAANRQQGEGCSKRPPVELLGKLPPGYSSHRGQGVVGVSAGAAAAAGGAGGGGGGGEMEGRGGVGDDYDLFGGCSRQPEDAGWGAAVGGGSITHSCAAATTSSSSVSGSSSGSFQEAGCGEGQGAGEGGEGLEWHDAIE